MLQPPVPRAPRPRRRVGIAAALAIAIGLPEAAAGAEPVPEGVLTTLFPTLVGRVERLPPLLRDSRFTLHLRTFYQNVQKSANDYDEAWAGGGWLEYVSGWRWNTLSVGGVLYTSQPLYAPADREGTLLLQPDGEGFTVLGEAWARLKYEDHVITGYRQQVDLGYVNPHDGRMAPNTFEGVMLNGRVPFVDYAAGYLTRMKPRNADGFISMSQAAGAAGTHSGAGLGGIRLTPWPSLKLHASTVYALDTFSTVFAEGEYRRSLADDATLSFGAQYTHQQSVGSELLGSFASWTVGARASVEAGGLSAQAMVHRTGSGHDIQTPFGRWPGYLKMITTDFDLARQTAAGVRIGYDLSRIGAPGVSARFSFAAGMDAIDPATGNGRPDEQEYDFDAIYAPGSGWLSGVSFRVRVGLVRQAGSATLLPDIRLIMNYEIPVMRGALARRIRAWWLED